MTESESKEFRVTEVGEIRQEVADLCIEFWKLLRGATKAAKLLPEADGKRLDAQIRYSERQLERLSNELSLRLIEFDGEEYYPGIAASADNAEDFKEGARVSVVKTIEPAVVKDMRVVRMGRVLIGAKSTTKE